MATVKAGGVSFDLTLGAAGFISNLGRAQRALSSRSAQMNRTLARLDRGFSGVQRGVRAFARGLNPLTLAIGAAGGAGGMGLLVKRSLDTADAIAKTATATGLSTDALQEFRFAAEQSGVETTSLESSLTAFTKRMGELAANTGPLVSGLKGVDQALLNQLRAAQNTEQAFGLVIRAMERAETATDRARIANAAFSRSGVELANLVRDGAGGFDELRRKARDLGLVIEGRLLKSAEDTQDRLNELSRVIRTNVVKAVLELSPRIAELAEKMTEGLPVLIEYTERFLDLIGVIDRTDPRDTLAAVNEEIERLKQHVGDGTSIGPAVKIFEADLAAALARAHDLEVQIEKEVRAEERLSRIRRKLGQEFTPASDPNARINPLSRVRPKSRPATIDFVNADQAAALERLAARSKASIEQIQRAQEGLAESGRAVFEATRTPAEAYAAQIEELNQLIQAGAIDQDTYNRAVEQAQDSFEAAASSADKFRRAGEDAAASISRGFEDALVRAESLQDGIRGLAIELQRILLRTTVTGPLQSALSGVLGGLFGGGGAPVANGPPVNLLGFASGGSFRVGGAPGVDNNLVQFMATRGEDVTVTPAGQSGAGGGTVIYQIDARGSEVGVERRIRAEIEAINRSIEPRSVAAVVDAQQRNPGLLQG